VGISKGFQQLSIVHIRLKNGSKEPALRLGSVAGPVIQATGRSEFEDGLWSGDFVSGYSYHMSVRTRLSDHTKQTKFQSSLYLSTEVKQHRDSQYLDE
jgi:hypothetical protein